MNIRAVNSKEHRSSVHADAAPRDLASRTRAAALRATVKIRSRSRSALKSCVFLQPSGLAASATSPRCDASMVLEWLEKSIPGTSGALRGFGAAGVVLAHAAGHSAAAAASRLASFVPISWLTACRCSVLHRGCVRALCDGCSSSMAADRWPTSIPCQGTSLVQRRPAGCALVSHGAAACVKDGHIFAQTL